LVKLAPIHELVRLSAHFFLVTTEEAFKNTPNSDKEYLCMLGQEWLAAINSCITTATFASNSPSG